MMYVTDIIFVKENWYKTNPVELTKLPLNKQKEQPKPLYSQFKQLLEKELRK